MNKYQIGDRLQYEGKYIGLIVRGKMMTSVGYRYFIEVDGSDNSFTINDDDFDEMLEALHSQQIVAKQQLDVLRPRAVDNKDY